MKRLLKVCAALLWIGIITAAAADPIDDLRARWLASLVGDEHLDAADPSVRIGIAQAARDAETVRASMTRPPRADAELWPDLDSAHVSRGITGDSRRLATMSIAYALRGSTLYHDPSLLADITAGLDWLLKNRYSAQTAKRFDNWWDWEIGTPLNLNQTLVCVGSDLPRETFQACCDAIGHFTPKIVATGANGLWRADITLRHGILIRDEEKIRAAQKWLETVGFRYWDPPADPTKNPFPEGFYRDGSFVGHGFHPYNAGYGFWNISFGADLLALVADSPWAVAGPDRNHVFEWVERAFHPIYYRGQLFDNMRGREIARPLVTPVQDGDRNPPAGPVKMPAAAGLVKVLLPLIAIAPPPHRASMQAFVKGFATPAMFAYLNVPQTAALRTLLADPAIEPEPPSRLFKQFPLMNRTVMLRPDFGASISMHSATIFNYESINTENPRGWHTADGWLQILNADAAQFTDGYWATVDWHRLPGTTVIRNSTRRPNQRNGSRWAGGADFDGVRGAAGLELQIKTDANETLAARKSWFLFDDEIVCLGSGITATGGEPVETILENRRLDGDNPPTTDGQGQNTRWLHLAGNVPGSDLAFVFPEPTAVQRLRESRSGSWKEINGHFGNDLKLTRRFLTLWLDHGAKPVNASYAYTILPNKPAEAVARYAANPATVILANTPELHAVEQRKLGLIAANFWLDEHVEVPGSFLTCDRKASVLVRRHQGIIELAVADPTLVDRGIITLTLNVPTSKVLETGKYFRVDAYKPQTVIKLDLTQVERGDEGRTFKLKLAE